MYSLRHQVLLDISEFGVQDSKEQVLRIPYRKWLEAAEPPLSRVRQIEVWKETEALALKRWWKMRWKGFSTEDGARNVLIDKFLSHVFDEDSFVDFVEDLCSRTSEETRHEFVEVLRLDLVPTDKLHPKHPMNMKYEKTN
jgi:hypothetical protein